ncbi:hypothetical protein HHK36_010330 [Tetracentron sinense]|uniref:Uncharacterized protein n=1 Tax=Tetracentron sinense TaxID=13715 RepID=A0A835DMI4_TETSI|nr:hypothetical protein HHK36_010330 [Tetracentron sinense]
MSRCFPYPPPGYARDGARDEALIDSIKLQREREKTKKERRKEKKREKKERENLPENEKTEEKRQSHKNRHKDEIGKVDEKVRDHQKRRQYETELLEKSSLTEEHEQPVISQSLYDSSDSTQSSHKRRKQSSPSNGSHNHGSVIRIRLLQQKHKDLEGLPSKEQPCSKSGAICIAVQEKYEIASRSIKEQPCSTSGRTKIRPQEIAPRAGKEQLCSTSGSIDERLTQMNAETAPASIFFGSGSLQIESQIRDLIENWVPPPVEGIDFDDQDWLFETKQHHKHEAKRVQSSNDSLSYGCSTLQQPRACYLSEADIYALPFTLPF